MKTMYQQNVCENFFCISLHKSTLKNYEMCVYGYKCLNLWLSKQFEFIWVDLSLINKAR